MKSTRKRSGSGAPRGRTSRRAAREESPDDAIERDRGSGRKDHLRYQRESTGKGRKKVLTRRERKEREVERASSSEEESSAGSRERVRSKPTKRVKQREYEGPGGAGKSRSEENREGRVGRCARRGERVKRRPRMVVSSEDESCVESRDRSRVRQRSGVERCEGRGCRGCVGGKRGRKASRAARQRLRTEPGFRVKNTARSPSTSSESSSDELEREMARVALKDSQSSSSEMDCGGKVPHTSRGKMARKGDVRGDPPPLKRVKRVRNAEEFEARMHNRPKREKQVLTYDGSTSWKDFYVHFEACKEYNKWTDREATYQLFTCCQGNALTALSVNDVDPKEMKYDELVKLMGKEFGPRECSELYFHELSKREQKPGESLYDLGQDIKRLTALAYPRTERKERDRIAREHFKGAITDPELRKELFRTHPDTLEAAVQGALAVESFYRTERTKGRNRLAFSRVAETGEVPFESGAEVDKQMDENLGAKIREMERKMDRVAREMEVKKESRVERRDRSPVARRTSWDGRESAGTKQGRSGVCYSCQQPGHVARYCPQVVCFRCRESGHRIQDCLHKSVVCNKCRMEGHIARFCSSSGNGVRPTQGPVGRLMTQ